MERRATWSTRIPLAASLMLVATLFACSGPESSSPLVPSSTPTQVASEPETTPTPTEPEVTVAPTATETPTPEPTPTASPTPEATATPTPEPTPTQPPVAMSEALPPAEALPGAGFVLANEGPRSAIDLANAYSDPSEHLDRLDDWGFEEHYFREFSREAGGDSDSLPTYLLTTGNQYGGVGQAEEAINWLRRLNSSQGHDFADPPEFGDNAIASTIDTVEGAPTAIVFVRIDGRVFAAFASGGDPLPYVLQVGELIVERAGWEPADGGDDGQEESTATEGAED